MSGNAEFSPYDTGVAIRIEREIRIRRELENLNRPKNIDPYNLNDIDRMTDYLERIKKIRSQS